MQKDSVVGTILVAAVLCILCSVLVSGAAVLLKDRQDANRILDIKKNLLMASGLLKDKSASKEKIEEVFSTISVEVVDLSTGKIKEGIDPMEFDQQKARSNPKTSTHIEPSNDLADIKKRSKLAKVYKYVSDGEVQMYILPVYGKGLWSTMYGFLALASDLQTIKGIGFYQHGETPGLGGEIENPKWQEQWVGKKVYGADFSGVEFEVVKGSVNLGSDDSKYQVDGLSGATITSNGVTNMMRYWLGPNGFGEYIKNQKSGASSSEKSTTEKTTFKRTKLNNKDAA